MVSRFLPVCLGTLERVAAAPKPSECFVWGTARISSVRLCELKELNFLGWFQRKQNERRCRAQGFRPKLCQATRWKEENNRTGQLLDS